jgi:hypothetical protein
VPNCSNQSFAAGRNRHFDRLEYIGFGQKHTARSMEMDQKCSFTKLHFAKQRLFQISFSALMIGKSLGLFSAWASSTIGTSITP